MENWPKITLFGDSITRYSLNPDEGCWASYIGHQVASYYSVDVRGFSGYSSKWLVDETPKLFNKEYLKNVEVFVMFIGHNDCWNPELAPQATTLQEFEANIRTMLEHLTSNGLSSKDIIMITPTWYDLDLWTRHRNEQNKPLVTKSLEDATNFADAAMRIANELNITVIDFYRTSLNYEPLANLFCDGVHFSKTGAKLLFNLLWPEIKQKIETRHNKPLDDIWHLAPYEERADFKEAVAKYLQQQQQQQQSASK